MNEKSELQSKYCNENDYPRFAPEDKCWHCNNNIWDNITLEDAKTKLITGCPICYISFCE